MARTPKSSLRVNGRKMITINIQCDIDLNDLALAIDKLAQNGNKSPTKTEVLKSLKDELYYKAIEYLEYNDGEEDMGKALVLAQKLFPELI